MKPLLILIVSFLIVVGWMTFFNHALNFPYAGRIAMAVMLIFTFIGHIKYADGMRLMLPSFIPHRKRLVYFTGALELLAAVGLMMSSPWPVTSGWFLITFFILLLPANIYAAKQHLDYEEGNYQGPGVTYLWFRVPLQVFFICWVYFFAIAWNK